MLSPWNNSKPATRSLALVGTVLFIPSCWIGAREESGPNPGDLFICTLAFAMFWLFAKGAVRIFGHKMGIPGRSDLSVRVPIVSKLFAWFVLVCTSVLICPIVLILKAGEPISWTSIQPMIWQLYTISAILCLSICIVIKLDRVTRQNAEIALSTDALIELNHKEHLSTLKMKLNPTLFFESLTYLNELMLADKAGGVQLVDNLSEVYRYSLAKADNELVSLAEEIDFLQAYAAVMPVRMRFSLSTHHDLEEYQTCHIAPMVIREIIDHYLHTNAETDNRAVRIEPVPGQPEYIAVSWSGQDCLQGQQSEQDLFETISKRCRYLTENPVRISKDQGHITYFVPIMKFENDYPDHRG